MHSKIIYFVVATLYIANASVITQDAYNGDVQSPVNAEDSPVSRACNNQECNQRCRRFKHPGGICVDDRCICDKFRSSEDFEALIEEYISWRCNPEKCNKKCQSKKLPGGKCVKRRCKCDKPERVDDSLTADSLEDDDEIEEFDLPSLEGTEIDDVVLSSNPIDFSEKRRCSQRICNFKCARKGLGTGTCADGKCKCSKQAEASFNAGDVNDDEEFDLPLNELEENDVDVAELSSDPQDFSEKRRCSRRICNFKCARKGLGTGTCADGKCKCSKQAEALFNAGDINDDEEFDLPLNEREENDVDIAELSSDPQDFSEKRRCSRRICNFKCARKGLGTGTCADGKCKCSKQAEASFNAGDVNDDEEFDLPLNELEDNDADVAELSSEPSDSSGKRRCSRRICNFKCARKGLGTGTCADGKCKCSKQAEASFNAGDVNDDEEFDLPLKELEDNDADVAELSSEPLDSSGKRRCSRRICNFKCARKGLGTGTCADGKCKCSKQAEASFNAGDVNDDEEFDLPLNELEENDVDVAELSSDPQDFSEKRRCSRRICNFKCARKGLGTGTCADGKCKCSKQAEASFNAGDLNDDEEFDLPLNELEENEVDVAGLSSDPQDFSEKRRCSRRICNFKCARKGLGTGTCADGKCKCSKQAADVKDAELFSNFINASDKRRCFQRICNLLCIKKGLGAGSCTDGKCECSKKEVEVANAVVYSDPIDFSDRRRCIPRVCNYICVLRGSGSGSCVDGRCKCADKVEKSLSPDDKTENAVGDSNGLVEEADTDLIELLSGKRRCIPRICKLKCIWKRFDNGTCVNDECKCANKESSTEVSNELVESRNIKE